MSVIERASVCTFDCPDTCSLTVTVEDGRIAKVRGSEAAPFTAGVICSKVARDMVAFVHGPRNASCTRCAVSATKARGSSSGFPGTPRWTRSMPAPRR
ncbi:MAG: hypothetical protein WDN25_21485 [Acetobacteraceae bacterium]